MEAVLSYVWAILSHVGGVVLVIGIMVAAGGCNGGSDGATFGDGSQRGL